MPWNEILIGITAFIVMKLGFAIQAKLFPLDNRSTEALSGKDLVADNSL